MVDRLITSDPQDWCAFGSCPRPAPPEPSAGSAASSYEAYADKVVATDRNYERVGVSVYGWLGINNFQQLVDANARNPDFSHLISLRQKAFRTPETRSNSVDVRAFD